jgi:hypothetical protein
MTEPTYSFVYDRTTTDSAFPGLAASALVTTDQETKQDER